MNQIQSLLDALSRKQWGMTRAEAWKQQICIRCQKAPDCKTELGAREYRISALCEDCFAAITKE